MHELSIMSYLLEAIEVAARQHAAQRVVTITVTAGERSGLVEDSLLFYFDLLTPGTVAEGARLNVRRTKMRFHCQQCDADYSRSGDDFGCPVCGTVGQLIDEACALAIDSLEIET